MNGHGAFGILCCRADVQRTEAVPMRGLPPVAVVVGQLIDSQPLRSPVMFRYRGNFRYWRL